MLMAKKRRASKRPLLARANRSQIATAAAVVVVTGVGAFAYDSLTREAPYLASSQAPAGAPKNGGGVISIVRKAVSAIALGGVDACSTASCASSTPTPTPKPTSTPTTPAPTSTPAPTPRPTASLVPTPTPAPVHTPQPTPVQAGTPTPVSTPQATQNSTSTAAPSSSPMPQASSTTASSGITITSSQPGVAASPSAQGSSSSESSSAQTLASNAKSQPLFWFMAAVFLAGCIAVLTFARRWIGELSNAHSRMKFVRIVVAVSLIGFALIVAFVLIQGLIFS